MDLKNFNYKEHIPKLTEEEHLAFLMEMAERMYDCLEGADGDQFERFETLGNLYSELAEDLIKEIRGQET